MLINRCWNCMEDLGGNTVCPKCGFNPEMHKLLPYALRPNTILHGKYLIGNVLGQGGYGITYIGFDLTLELKVAIKEYFPTDKAMRSNERGNMLYWRRSDSGEEIWRSGCNQFLFEARKMAKINSVPEIVSVRDTFEENNTAYIVMDFVPGVTMKDYMHKNGCFRFDECVELLLPMIEGLDRVHRQGIIHRDISPDNLMITPEGKVYLLDLGAAKDMKDSRNQTVAASKKGFSPIEQNSSSGQVGPWTDVYALAASIYYCVYGKLVPHSLARFEEDTLEFPQKAKNPLTPQQIAVLKKGLAIKQELRYQTAMEFYIALRDSLSGKKGKKISKKTGRILGIAAAAAAAVAAAGLLLVSKPWMPSVEIYGNNGPYPGAYFAIAEGKNEYYIDLDNALVRVPYDQEQGSFFLDTGEIIYDQVDSIYGDGSGSLNLAEDKLYTVYFGGAGKSDYLIAMNHDGSEQEQLLELPYDHTNLQYVKLSNGQEYFYYLMDDGSVEGEYHFRLYRYGLKAGTAEQLVAEEASWFAVFDKYVYYTVWNEEKQISCLYRVTLDGGSAELLDDTHGFWDGVVADGQLYLIQARDAHGAYSVGMIACNAEGKPVQEGKGIFGIDWQNVSWTVGGGWIYYWENGTNALYRIRLDGTENSRILEGYQYHRLSYSGSQLYFQDGMVKEDGTFHPYQAYIARDDGSTVVSCGFELKDLVNEDGVRFVIDSGEARVVGYSGTSRDIILPLEFNGYPLNDDVNWDEFVSDHVPVEELHFYATMQEEELVYTKNANGVIITGYTGKITGAVDHVAVPTQIAGMPVVRIEEEAFASCTFKRVYLPKQLQEVGYRAFHNCADLLYAVFPETLTYIEAEAFAGCSFAGADVVLPEGLTSLGGFFLDGCSPKTVTLPASLKNIGDGFLANCGGDYQVDKSHSLLKAQKGVLLSKDGSVLYAFPCDRKGSYKVPETVKEIYAYAFYGCRITELKLPEGLQTIGEKAFMYSKGLKTLEIPKSVTAIGAEAFYHTGLESVKIKWGVAGKEGAFDDGVKIGYYTSGSKPSGGSSGGSTPSFSLN